MGELKNKYKSAQKALLTLKEILEEAYSPIIRDAAIQRFEYTFEICWKTAQVFLREKEGIIANSPKSVFREALSANLLHAEEVERALEMTDDRNLTTHTYHEEVARSIYDRLPDYYTLMDTLLHKISQEV